MCSCYNVSERDYLPNSWRTDGRRKQCSINTWSRLYPVCCSTVLFDLGLRFRYPLWLWENETTGPPLSARSPFFLTQWVHEYAQPSVCILRCSNGVTSIGCRGITVKPNNISWIGYCPFAILGHFSVYFFCICKVQEKYTLPSSSNQTSCSTPWKTWIKKIFSQK